jgi:hypothetical protein
MGADPKPDDLIPLALAQHPHIVIHPRRPQANALVDLFEVQARGEEIALKLLIGFVSLLLYLR